MIRLDTSAPNRDKFNDYINKFENYNYIDYEKLVKTSILFNQRIKTCDYLLHLQSNILRGDKGFSMSPDDVYKEVLEKSGDKIIRKTLKYKNGKGYTLKSDKLDEVISYIDSLGNKAGQLLKEACNYYELNKDMTKMRSYLSTMNNGVKESKITETDIVGYNNSKLLEMVNYYVERVTGRMYSKEMSIISLPLEARKDIVAPKDYFLVSCDLDQIDLVIAYNIYLVGYNSQYDKIFFEEKKDKYKAMYKIVCLYNGMEEDLDYFEENRSSFKRVILSGLYCASENTMRTYLGDKNFCDGIRKYYDNQPGYSRIITKICSLYELDVPIEFNDAFGFDMVLNPKSDGEGSQRDLEMVIKDIISWTVQATSFTVLIKWTNHIMEQFNNKGYKNYDISPCMVRHDEIVFLCRKSIVKDYYIIEDAKQIQISNWCPIGMSTEVSIHYLEDEEEPKYQVHLDEINESISKSLEGWRPTMVEPEFEPTKETIPEVYTIYAMSILPPKNSVYYFDFEGSLNPDDMSEDEVFDIITKKSNINEMHCYKDYYNRFVLINPDGTQEKYKGIAHLIEKLEEKGVKYADCKTIIGNDFEVIGKTNCICDTSIPMKVLETIGYEG